jgi:hypothetical protein
MTIGMGVYKFSPDETVLEDSYPVHTGYVYIFDGVFYKSPLTGTVADLKQLGAKEVRRCDLFGHKGAKLGDKVEN